MENSKTRSFYGNNVCKENLGKFVVSLLPRLGNPCQIVQRDSRNFFVHST